ncbi:DNA/RNA non-specific endonuclease [Oceanirhabdus sp. W0125-5]|uniref:DNA/RNA non-specific endonuclease n=1 Tax=Oceanirhabdus sp. W0125-5 TaxID=2999116 RepID=UPI0022F31D28|nr:DNA/RNA non-specific endonuclease [Oceanirhabdus sp. W0125-5]WBW95937.1 DNA/RNA non-specific endonuclease [Oceanirhabdus sp. W0125-5]
MINQGVVDDVVEDVTTLANKGELTDETVNEVLDVLEAQNNPGLADEILDVQEAAETFMDGDQYTKVNRRKTLKSDITYQTPGGHLYTTDSAGRISNVKGNLEPITAKRSEYSQRIVGRDVNNPSVTSKLTTDDGGHLIASQFNGSGGLDNLVPMDSKLNRAGGDWYKMEQEWASALEANKEVFVEIDVIYEGASSRPSKFVVEYTIDGKLYEKEWVNTIGGN